MGCEMAPVWSGLYWKVKDLAPVPNGEGPEAPVRTRIV